jgi:hypothetical protein
VAQPEKQHRAVARPAIALLTFAIAAWALWALFHGPSHPFWLVLGAPAGWTVLLFAYTLLITAHATWAILWLRPPRVIERKVRRAAMATLGLLSSMPYVLWLAVVVWTFTDRSVLGQGGDLMMLALSRRPVPAMFAAALWAIGYAKVAPQRMARSHTTIGELGLGVGGCVAMAFFAWAMTIR